MANDERKGISLKKLEVIADITNRYGSITQIYHFVNTDTKSSQNLKYSLSLNKDVFISKFEIEINGEILFGKTKEKVTAKKEYNLAVKKGDNAVLISNDDEAHIFTIQTNLEKNGKAILFITTEQFIKKRFGKYEFGLNLINKYYNDVNKILNKIKNIKMTININDKNGIKNIKTFPFHFDKIKLNDIIYQNHQN